MRYRVKSKKRDKAKFRKGVRKTKILNVIHATKNGVRL